MDLFVSQYLNIYPSHRDTMILFNGISGAIDEVSRVFGRHLESFRVSRESMSQGVLKDSEISFLIRRGHLTKLPPDQEREMFKRYVGKMHALLNERRKREGFLMIVPSYYCNLKCPYCFQNRFRSDDNPHKEFMTEAQVHDIFERAVPELFPELKSLRKVSLCLYGGEPFLLENREAIDAIMGYALKNQMKVSAISNTTEIHHFLKWFGPLRGYVNDVQISFDGDKNYHDCSRVTKFDEPTFERILENIHSLVDLKVNVGIRINTTKANVDGIVALVKRLDEEELLDHPLVKVYAWAVHCYGEVLDRSEYLENWDLSRIVETYSKKVESPTGRRERRLKRVIDTEAGLALRRTAFCMRNMPYSYLIDLYGDLYGCYEEAGDKDKRIGTFSVSEGVEYYKKYKVNQSRHVATCEPCSGCGLALTCGGGCPHAATADYGTQHRGDCDSHKECVARAIQRLFEEKSENHNA